MPDFQLADQKFLLTQPADVVPDAEKAAIKEHLLASIRENAMLPFYDSCCEQLGWQRDEGLAKEMATKNTEALQKIEDKIADANENLGDSEVLDGMIAKAEHYTRIGDQKNSLEAYEAAYAKTIGAGGRLDNVLAVIRVALFFQEYKLAKTNIERAQVELQKGGEWERRNKLRVYKGVYLMATKEFKAAGASFLDATATFTATELVTFRQFVFYTVITAMVALDRKTNKDKVLASPEVLTAVHETPHLKEFMFALHNCKYAEYFKHFVGVLDEVKKDRFLAPQFKYLIRHLRLNAYRQFLQSYKSVTLSAMSSAFGVSPQFIDSEMSAFIAAGQIPCKIDAVNGIIESNEEDGRNQKYVQMIKQGDVLLSRMQKLSKVIDM